MKTKYFHKLIANKLLKFFGVLLFISTFCIHTNAQTVYYNYDNKGNRTADYILEYGDIKPKTTKKDSVPCNITVYPNPTNGQVNVSIPCIQNCEDAMIYISDASGGFVTI